MNSTPMFTEHQVIALLAAAQGATYAPRETVIPSQVELMLDEARKFLTDEVEYGVTQQNGERPYNTIFQRLFTAYKAHVAAAGHTALSQTRFGKLVAEQDGVRRDRSPEGLRYIGLRLKVGAAP